MLGIKRSSYILQNKILLGKSIQINLYFCRYINIVPVIGIKLLISNMGAQCRRWQDGQVEDLLRTLILFAM